MGRRALLFASGLGLIVLVACAGKGEVIPIDIRGSDSAGPAKTKETGGPSVAVTAFEDSRPEKNRLGTRTHFLGGESYFNLLGGKPGAEVAAQAVADYLKMKGWRAELVKPGGSGAESNAEVTLSGKLLDLSVDAKGKFLQTEISSKIKIVVQALNRADGSTVRMTLNGAGTESVFWFDPEDAQGLVNEVLIASLEKLVGNTKVENDLLRLN
ncbi:MAG: hypothetical protein E6K69_03935 [Nitrospirae bacterium]|nr:MAG: hypothetical protein E6K69_03935 [Nitrospirota bacterium]